MPGAKSKDRAGASYITPWELHREIDADDDPGQLGDVVEVLDLSRNEDGLNNQIWLALNRTAGAGTIDITLYRQPVGSWADVVPWELVATETALAHLEVHAFSGLLAGVYKVVVTNTTADSEWEIHVAHT